jgi:hypothetical protein
LTKQTEIKNFVTQGLHQTIDSNPKTLREFLLANQPDHPLALSDDRSDCLKSKAVENEAEFENKLVIRIKEAPK